MANRATKDFRHEFDPTHQYLNELASTDLFEGDEERQAFIVFEKTRIKYQQVKKEYEAERNRLSRLNGQSTEQDHQNAQRLKRKAKRWEEKYNAARNEIVVRNTRLVISIAKKHAGQGVELGDLIQWGNLGMFRAIEKFDLSKGFQFSTYATWWIRQAVTRAISDTKDTIRKPVHVGDKINAVRKRRYKFYQEHGEWPTAQQIADYMGMEAEKVEYYLEISQFPISLEVSLNEYEDDNKGEFTGHNVLAKQEDIAPGIAESNQRSETLEQVLSTLTPREAQILRLRFGLNDGRAHTLEEVGQKFGVTRERIRQIEGQALRKLRHPRRSRHLRDYLGE